MLANETFALAIGPLGILLRLDGLRMPEGEPIPPNTLAELNGSLLLTWLRHDMERRRLVRSRRLNVQCAALQASRSASASSKAFNVSSTLPRNDTVEEALDPLIVNRDDISHRLGEFPVMAGKDGSAQEGKRLEPSMSSDVGVRSCAPECQLRSSRLAHLTAERSRPR